MADLISQARASLAAARSPVVFTGAGVSADSGVPTFRGVAGASGDTFWGKYDPMQLATRQGFRDDPKLVYDWYNWRRSQLAKVRPNPAHHAIARLQRDRNAVVITQNVDGLHERAAPPQAIVHRVHGTISADRCMGPHCDYTEESTSPISRRCATVPSAAASACGRRSCGSANRWTRRCGRSACTRAETRT